MPDTLTLAIGDTADVERARREARQLALAQGFLPVAADGIALAVSELATNLVRHAVGGEITISPVTRPAERGLQVESIDRGPGIPDVNAAMTRGHGNSGSMGQGLAVIRRQVDDFEVESSSAGTRIVIRKWHAEEPVEARPVAIAVATRPFPGEEMNGDAWDVAWHGAVCRVSVVDGLGHGPDAASAAQAALAALAANPGADVAAALRLLHGALGHTRGAVAAIALVDTTARTLTYGGVGNVDARLWQGGEEKRLISYRGILGVTLPNLRVFEFRLQPDWQLVFYTDGVSSRFVLSDEPAFLAGERQALAEALVQKWGRETDDATVVIAYPRWAAKP